MPIGFQGKLPTKQEDVLWKRLVMIFGKSLIAFQRNNHRLWRIDGVDLEQKPPILLQGMDTNIHPQMPIPAKKWVSEEDLQRDFYSQGYFIGDFNVHYPPYPTFECQRCGYCCEHISLVQLAQKEDYERITKYMKKNPKVIPDEIKDPDWLAQLGKILLINPNYFQEYKATAQAEGKQDLDWYKFIDQVKTYPCIFLKKNEDGTYFCPIHEVRTEQCRNFPFANRPCCKCDLSKVVKVNVKIMPEEGCEYPFHDNNNPHLCEFHLLNASLKATPNLKDKPELLQLRRNLHKRKKDLK